MQRTKWSVLTSTVAVVHRQPTNVLNQTAFNVCQLNIAYVIAKPNANAPNSCMNGRHTAYILNVVNFANYVARSADDAAACSTLPSLRTLHAIKIVCASEARRSMRRWRPMGVDVGNACTHICDTYVLLRLLVCVFVVVVVGAADGWSRRLGDVGVERRRTWAAVNRNARGISAMQITSDDYRHGHAAPRSADIPSPAGRCAPVRRPQRRPCVIYGRRCAKRMQGIDDRAGMHVRACITRVDRNWSYR